MTDVTDQVFEAILGPDLTRKLDDYLAGDEGQNPCGKRHTRLEAIKGSAHA